MSTASFIQAVRHALSAARMSTYDGAAAAAGGGILEALELYDWNAQFAFWQMMFTGRHDNRVWNANMFQAMPNLHAAMSVANARAHIYSKLEHIRRLRNRIAHHEPIFIRDLAADLERMAALIRLRSHEAADWMTAHEKVTPLLKSR